MKKRCFVISPIGAEGSPTREHADDVYECIIKPAMAACDMHAVRSDHLREPGKISEQMFKEILTDDVCVAVLIEDNPNVYYELAIAQAAARPVIILLLKGKILPFDIQDLRCVYYDLKPRSVWGKIYVNELVEHIQSLERGGWKGTTPWNAFPLVNLNEAAGQTAFLEHSQDYGNSDVWLQLLQNTQQTFDLMGISLSAWRRTRRFSEILKEKAASGCKIRFLLMDKDSPALRHLINEAIPEARYSIVLRDIEEMTQYFSEIRKEEPKIEVRQIRHGCPHVQLTRSDQQAVFVMYLFSERSHFSPLWQCARDSSLYRTLTQEFDALWEANGPPSVS
jgi:hypothetical protein